MTTPQKKRLFQVF